MPEALVTGRSLKDLEACVNDHTLMIGCIPHRLPALALALALASPACIAPISVESVDPPLPAPRVVPRAALETTLRAQNPPAEIASILDILRPVEASIRAGDMQAIPEYNFLVARLIEALQELGPQAANGVSIAGPEENLRLVRGDHPPDLQATPQNFVTTDSVEFRGKYAVNRATRPGIGASVISYLADPDNEEQIASRTFTVLVRFEGETARIDLKDPYQTEFVSFGNLTLPLNADYGAALSYVFSTERIDKLGLIRLILPSRYADTAELRFLQPYDPDRIPVLFVHGLQDTPASFTPMYLGLIADPEIRRNYQFWFFSYPSGYPYPYSASILREELDRVQRSRPGHKDIVIVGHSMGGLISRLMITDPGDELWNAYISVPPAESNLIGRSRDLLERSLVFQPREEIGRAIFLSAPHRGSVLAANWIGRLAARLIRLPTFLADTRNSILSVVTLDPSALVLDRAPNSIDTLAPNNRFIRAINRHPIKSDVPFHSIMGDRGKSLPRERTSDGVVAYWSSHLDGAASEKLVPSGHRTQLNPEAIAEVRRILRLHAGLPPPR